MVWYVWLLINVSFCYNIHTSGASQSTICLALPVKTKSWISTFAKIDCAGWVLWCNLDLGRLQGFWGSLSVPELCGHLQSKFITTSNTCQCWGECFIKKTTHLHIAGSGHNFGISLSGWGGCGGGRSISYNTTRRWSGAGRWHPGLTGGPDGAAR